MPTVVISENTGADYSGCEDSGTMSDAADNNRGASTELYVKNGWGGKNTAFFKFSGVSNIPSGATVSDATISIYGSCGTNDTPFAVYYLLRNWGEGNKTNATADAGESSWNCYASPSTWSSGGGLGSGTDRNSSSDGDITYGTSASYQSISVTTTVSGHIGGTINNYGWVLYHNTTDDITATLVSSEGADGHRPSLSVTYTASGGAAKGYYYMRNQ